MDKQYMIEIIKAYGGKCNICDCENCDNEQNKRMLLQSY